MDTKPLPLVVKIAYCDFKDHEQAIVDQYANQMTMVPLEQLTKDQYPLVRAVLRYGLDKITAEFMDFCPNLRVISSVGAGVRHLEVEEATKRGIKMGNTPNAVHECTADLAFALLLASARNVVQGDAICKNPSIQKYDIHWYGHKVSGSTIGIVGLGRIGSGVAERAQGFKMNVLYYSRTRKEHLETELGIQYCHTLTDLLKQADFVVLCTPLTTQTQNLIGASELSCMKKSATLINIARGGIINQEDLVKALQTDQIRAAALDVTTPEPLPRDHPLLSLPNVIITPHMGTATEDSRNKMITATMENLVAGLKEEPLPYPVN